MSPIFLNRRMLVKSIKIKYATMVKGRWVVGRLIDYHQEDIDIFNFGPDQDTAPLSEA